MSDRVCGADWTSLDCFFEWLFPLSGFRASESGIDCCVFGVVAIVAMVVSIASWPAVAISGI